MNGFLWYRRWYGDKYPLLIIFGEVIDGLTVMIDNKINGKETDVEELMEYIKGPDFPTGATILGKSGIRAAYRYRQRENRVRSTAEIQPMGNGREKSS